ncbi:hypothetical protein LDK13_02945 [Fusobacterium animalis]|uniref:hypothetical protein n=1 Tax=Fusobacterium animalis TaxID=76859 RepID=UPI00040EE034|nr:hypothetical protein [Fusobacterium animalis]
MQDSEENLKKEKRNYAKEQLIKLGFLSKDNIEKRRRINTKRKKARKEKTKSFFI